MTDTAKHARVALLEQQIDGLPPCPWLQAEFGGESEEALFEDMGVRRRYLIAMDTHPRTCEICGRRESLVSQLRAEQEGPFTRIVVAILVWTYRRPVWLQPALIGAEFMGAMSLMRIVVVGLLGRVRPLDALLGLGASAAIGFGAGLVGGNAYRVIRPKADAWGRAGPYLSGLLFTLALGLATSLVLMLFPETAAGFWDGWAWKVVGSICLVVGPILGHLWFRPGKKFAL